MRQNADNLASKLMTPMRRRFGIALVAVAFVAGGAAVPAIGQSSSAAADSGVFFSGPVIDGPDYCLNASFGGPVTYPLDSDGDGVADVCSLPRTRRAAAARQRALERLGEDFHVTLAIWFAQECLAVPETLGEPEAEAEDECAAPRAADPASLPPVPPRPVRSPADSEVFFSGPVINSPDYCLNASFGGPVTYPFDSDGDGVADVCSLPRTRRAAAARQNALERLGELHSGYLSVLVYQECQRVPGTFGEPEAEAQDECSRPAPILVNQPAYTHATGTTPATTPAPTPTPAPRQWVWFTLPSGPSP